MSLRQLWWEWNPKRLRRLLSMKDGQINANANLAAHYHREMLALKKSVEQVNQTGTQMMDDIVTRLRGQRTNGVICEQAADEIEKLRRTIKVLEHTLEAKEDSQND